MNGFKHRIKSSLSSFEKRKYSKKIELIYKGHVPFVAFLIAHGSLELYSSSKKYEIVETGEFVGLENLLTKSPMTFSVIVTPNTELFILDRSTLSEL